MQTLSTMNLEIIYCLKIEDMISTFFARQSNFKKLTREYLIIRAVLLMKDCITKIFIWPYKVRKNTLYDDVYIERHKHIIIGSFTRNWIYETNCTKI